MKNRNLMEPIRESVLWLLVGCIDHFGIGDVFDFVASVIDHDSATSFAQRDAVACGTEVQDLRYCQLLLSREVEFINSAYLDIRQAIPLHGCDASTFIKLDLPDAAEVG